MRHQQATDEILHRAALYALGSLEPEAAADFERHLEAGCPLCEDELLASSRATVLLASAAAPAMPRPQARERLFAALGAAELVVRTGAIPWDATPVEGLSMKRLFDDPAERRFVALVHMEAGGHYPGHWHHDAEELYVLEGRLVIDEQQLGAGDFYAAPAGNVHDIWGGEGGCTCLIVSPQTDEALDEAAGPGGRALLHVSRASEARWTAGLARGLEQRILYVDRARGTLSALVRMAPGASIPRHRHITSEQFLLLDGDALVEGQRLGAGDFYRIPAGTVHETTSTEGGCSFLLLASCLQLTG